MEHTRVPKPPARPLLIYDGHCGFCLWWLARWRRRVGDRIDYAPSQEAARRYPWEWPSSPGGGRGDPESRSSEPGEPNPGEIGVSAGEFGEGALRPMSMPELSL